MLIAVGAAGCGGSDSSSQPPLVLTQANAQAVTAKAVLSASSVTSSAQIPGLPAAAARRVASVQRATAEYLTSPRATDGPAFDTQPCSVSGSITTTMSGTGAAGSTASLTFTNCKEDANTTINGSLQLTVKSGSADSTSFTLSITLNLTVTAGPVTVMESGGYDLTLKSSSGSTGEVQLSGSRLTVSISGAGTASDSLTLSNFNFDVTENSSTGESSSTIDYDLDTTLLKGHISVMTSAAAAVKQLLDKEFPHAGQLLITGANHGRLQITILGDETFTPPAGQGQVKIELDTGSGTFGAPIFVSWAMLQASAG